ncbi:MAG: hypothetical protein AAFP82_04275 [Bacteroidota bacterium]
MLLAVDTIREKTVEKFEAPIAKQAIDTFYQDILIYDESYKDTIKVPFSLLGNTMRYAREDFNNLLENELIEKYLPEKSFFVKLARKQEVRFLKSNENIITFFLGKVTWLVFITLPIFALFMKLLYIRRDFYYVEHLIFSFHMHTLLFLWAIIIILLDDFLHEGLEAASLLLVTAYIVMSMKFFYQQGWWKTIFKFCIANFAYWIIIILGIIITGFLSFLLF